MAGRKQRNRRHRGAPNGAGKKGNYDRKDAYYRRAKAEGYRSRAAYKLLEVAERYQLLPRGGRILDLGCWPGGWLQVAAAVAGPNATIVGVDLKETEPLPGVTVLTGDVRDVAALEAVRRATPGGAYDVVLADLSPNLSGVKSSDEARASELNDMTIAVAEAVLVPGGKLLMKTFMSGETQAMMRRARSGFSSVRLTNLAASRKGSGEQYLVARDRRPRAPDFG